MVNLLDAPVSSRLRRGYHGRLLRRKANPTRKAGLPAAALLSASLFLTACATHEPQTRTVEVKVPIAVKCGTDPGPDPTYSDSPQALKAAQGLFEKVKLLLAGREQRNARILELKGSQEGCF